MAAVNWKCCFCATVKRPATQILGYPVNVLQISWHLPSFSFQALDSLHFAAFSVANFLCSVLLCGSDNVLLWIHWNPQNVPILHLKQRHWVTMQDISAFSECTLCKAWIFYFSFCQHWLFVFFCSFRLYLKGHSGTAGKQSSLILHGAEFSTKDADNDNCMCKCALMLTGGEYNSENMWYIDKNLLCFPKSTMDEVALTDV